MNKKTPKATLNLFKNILANKETGDTVRVFYKAVIEEWSDEKIKRFEAADLNERKNIIRDTLEKYKADDAEVFARCTYEPEGIKPPVKTFLDKRGRKKKAK